MKNINFLIDQDSQRAHDPIQNYLDKNFIIKALTLIAIYFTASSFVIDSIIFDPSSKKHLLANPYYVIPLILFALLILHFAKKKRLKNRPWTKK